MTKGREMTSVKKRNTKKRAR